MPTPFQIHKRRWINCKRCPLAEHRHKVCLVRGKLPADILFVGEAPGVSEDTLGSPFVGPAGKLLDMILKDAMPPRTVEVDGELKTIDVRYAITNVIGCIPKDDEKLKVGEPPKFAVVSCRPRLTEIINLVKPRLIVQVGKHSEKYTPAAVKDPKKFKWLAVIHPAAIMRMDVSQKGLAIQRTRVAIARAVDALFSEA